MFSSNNYATHWYVNVKKNTRFEVQYDPSKGVQKEKVMSNSNFTGANLFLKEKGQVKDARKSMFEWFST